MTTINTDTSTQVEKRTPSLPRILLSIEGLVIFISSIAAYGYIGGNGWLFIALLLAPDLVFIIYMLDKRIGTIAYNIVHSYSLPIALAIISLFTSWQPGMMLALIWCAHIGMDRTIGYGLKYQTAFKDTHLQRA